MAKYVEELVNQQVRRYELARQRSVEVGRQVPNPVLTISRSMGAGVRFVARKLADDLGWSLWGRELLDSIAKTAEVSAKVAEAFDERTVSEIDLLVLSALGDDEYSSFDYERHLARAVASIAKLGNAIILGRGAHFLLPEALHVRIDASVELRIANLMRFEELDRDAAEERIRMSDKERQQFLTKIWGKKRVADFDWDLTIWMDHFTVEGVVRILEAALADRFKLALPAYSTAPSTLDPPDRAA